MSEASQIVVLCEDKLHRVVVYRFLRSWGVGAHAIRMLPGPSSGAGEKYVRDRYPDEIKAFRARSAKARTALIVMVDADTRSVRERQAQIDAACRTDPRLAPRAPEEAVAHIVPKRNVSTWLAYLNGESVDEDTDYTARFSFRQNESACHPLIDGLSKQCRKQEDPGDRPPSLRIACDEFGRIKPIL